MKKFIGLNINDFKNLYPELKSRIVKVNGSPRVVTCDFKPGRLNISLENDIIVKIEEE